MRNAIQLTPYAKDFYDAWLLDPSDAQYNMVCADHVLDGLLDVTRLICALKRYVAERLLFNCHIQTIEGVPCWVEHNNEPNNNSLLDYSEKVLDQAALLTYVNQPFDLHHGPLYRFQLIQTAVHTHRLIIVLHHLLMDGITLTSGLFEPLSSYYNDAHYSEKEGLQQQAQALIHLEKTLTKRLARHKDEAAAFWQEALTDVEHLDVRCLKSKQDPLSMASHRGENPIKAMYFDFDQPIVSKLEALKARDQVSPYFYGQCIFALLLHRYTGQKRFSIAYPMIIREGADFKLGGQVNLNVMPYIFEKTTTLADLLAHVKLFFGRTVKDDARYGYDPVAAIKGALPNSAWPDVYFSQAYFRDTPFSFEGITNAEACRGLSVDGVTPNRLVFEQEPFTEGRLRYRVKYDATTLDTTLLKDFIVCYKKLFVEGLTDLIAQKHGSIYDYALLNKAQLEAVLSCSRKKQTDIDPLKGETMHGVFEQQVLATPEHSALVHKNQSLSYRALNEKANQLAHYLGRQYAPKPDDFILVCLDKSMLTVIAILAVLKSGAAYVPVADYPAERVAYILKDTAAKAIITTQTYRHKFSKNAPVVVLDDATIQTNIAQESQTNPTIDVRGKHLSYVIYTSGTTGTPKGVLQQHNNLLDLFAGMHANYHFTDKDVWVLYHNYVFDFSVWELFGALFYGGKLIIPTAEEIKDGLLFYQLCHREKLTVLNQTPSEFFCFIETAVKLKKQQPLSSLRYVMLGGESLSFRMLSKWFEIYPDGMPCLVNMYGITEMAIITTCKDIEKKDLFQEACSIGRPILKRNIYILDGQLVPLPLGAIGELYIAGGAARGYLNQPTLTQRHFIPNPFTSRDSEAVLYKTGDLARMLPSGNLEYRGRKDRQIKIRGHRIELAEIEYVLMTHPLIHQVVVQVTSNQQDHDLVAYYMGSVMLEQASLEAYLSQRLPAFMCPALFVQVNHFKRTINGKIDLTALPAPQFERTCTYMPPTNAQEKMVCGLFSEVLQISKIGIDDDFFERGGNSLKVIRLALLLQDYFEIGVADLFVLKTPRKIAKGRCLNTDGVKRNLENIKAYFKRKQDVSTHDKAAQMKIKHYLREAGSVTPQSFSNKSINTVLLTGATGFLGCNLLDQLLRLTPYTVYLLIRASNQDEATCRIAQRFQFYFDQSLQKQYSARIVVVCGDLEKDDLGLDRVAYRTLASCIDSIIHAAALVKYCGSESLFYAANVEATQRLLALSRLTALKDFHYISTCSVAHFGKRQLQGQRVFIESDVPDPSEGWHNIYNKTKWMGEDLAIQWRAQGVRSTIYRVGNLAFIAKNFKMQANIEENAFANWLKFLLKVGCITDELRFVQISEVDLTAQAIVTLFDKEQTVNATHHIFNPNQVDLSECLKNKVRRLPFDCFIDRIIHCINTHDHCDLLSNFLLYQGWLGENFLDKMNTKLLQKKTEYLLNKLHFNWPKLCASHLSQYFLHFFNFFEC